MSAPTEITVWVCDQCGYWRQEKATGIHQTTNPDNWRGTMVKHVLHQETYARVNLATPFSEPPITETSA